MKEIKKLFLPPKERVERVYFLFIWLIRTLLIGALIYEFYYARWELFFVSILALFLTLLPIFIEKRYQIKLPPEFHVFIVAFIYASQYLGGIQKFYYTFTWWDTMLHGISGFAMGMVGISIMYVLYKGNKIKASPGVIVFFGFCFATTIGVFWEMYEYLVDTFLGYNMQRVNIGTGVTDTMKDFFINAGGAFLASLIGYLYLKYGKSKVYRRVLDYLERKNPKFFNK